MWCAPAHAANLKIATWNLEWLTLRPAGDPALPAEVSPKRPEDIARLAAYARRLAADVVAFEEVDGATVAARIFPPAQYVLHLTHDPVVQRVGFAVRRGIPFTANPDVTALDVYPPDAPHPLRSGADITLDLPSGRLRMLAVHLKTGCYEGALRRKRRRACKTLREQGAVLQRWIARRAAEHMPFIVLGDFNRVMEGHDPFLAALGQAAPLRDAGEGRSDPCWGGGAFIDHILAGGAARGWLAPDTLRVLVYRETGGEWQKRLSDHCPVSVHFRLPAGTP